MKKIAYAILPVTMALFGCGESGSSNNASPASTDNQAASSNAAPAESSAPAAAAGGIPTVTVATTGRGVPLTYKNEMGALDGIELEIIREIGKQQGFQPEFIEAKWSELFDGVESGRYDIAVSNITWTAERAGKYSLSDSYLHNPTLIVFRESSGIKPKSLADLKNIKVSTMKGGSSEKNLMELGFTNIVSADSSSAAKNNFLKGTADAYLDSEYTFRHTQFNNKQEKFATFPLNDDNPQISDVVMVVNKAKPELLKQLNEGIKALKEGNKIEPIAEKHYSAVTEPQK